jgi:hypothetical protein
VVLNELGKKSTTLLRYEGSAAFTADFC